MHKDMGNTVPPRMCREAGTAVGWRHRPKSVITAAEEEVTRAGRRCGGVPRVVTVKIVLKRKDAEELVARLNAHSARERRARMTELKGELRAWNDDGSCGGTASPASCRDAWMPRLAPIQEN